MLSGLFTALDLYCHTTINVSSLPDISIALGWKPGPVDKELSENVLANE